MVSLAKIVSMNSTSTYFETESRYLELDLSLTNCILSSNIYDKWDDFDFVIVIIIWLI